MYAERFTVGLTPLATAARVARHRSALKFRIISAVVSFAILIVILLFLNPGWSPTAAAWLVAIWSAATLVWLVLSAIALQRAKKDLAAIGHGDALVIDRSGIEFLHPERVRADWGEVSALKVTGASFGAGPCLLLQVHGETIAKLPLSFLDTMPSAIDSATSAHSLGRVHVDASAMDRLF